MSALTRIWRFGITGLAATLVHIACAVTGIAKFSLDPAIANGLAFMVATSLSFGVNSKWSFSANMEVPRFFKYLTVTLIGAALSMMIATITAMLGWNYLYGIALVVLFVPPITFAGHNFWTYK